MSSFNLVYPSLVWNGHYQEVNTYFPIIVFKLLSSVVLVLPAWKYTAPFKLLTIF